MFSDVKSSFGGINGSKNQSLPNKDLKLMRKIHNWHWEEFLERLHAFLRRWINSHLLTVRHTGESGRQCTDTWVKNLGTFSTAEDNEDGENTRKVSAVLLAALPEGAVCPLPGQYGIWKLPYVREWHPNRTGWVRMLSFILHLKTLLQSKLR